jgi:rubredoxin
MPAERRQRLDAIGFVWDPHEGVWEEGFAALTSFRAREGHCRVSPLYKEADFKLGQWVSVQRGNRDAMLAQRRQRLDAIGFVWEPLQGGWDEGFAALTEYKAREGHCRVPRGHNERSLKLGQWVSTQRKARDTMSAERKQRLDDLGFIWDPHEGFWEEGFAALTAFKTREGHCRVPYLHVEGAFKLGQWVSDRRRAKDTISAERKQRLDDLGFIWDPHEGFWEEGFAALANFRAREDHCRVPKHHDEGTFKLGFWVRNQRKLRDTLSAERRQRLDAIGFVWRASEPLGNS